MRGYILYTALIIILMLAIIACSDSDTIKEHLENQDEAEKDVGIDIIEEGVNQSSIPITNHDEPSSEVIDTEFFFAAPLDMPDNTMIKVFKSKRVLELYGDSELIGRFRIGLGFNPEGDKEYEGDGRTPEGEYYICTRNNKSRYYLSLGVSYPNIKDAEKGQQDGLIDQTVFAQIKETQEKKQLPPWYTPLGGEICIHGGGNSSDWTEGCIALDNEDMDILWEYSPLGTPIVIYQ